MFNKSSKNQRFELFSTSIFSHFLDSIAFFNSFSQTNFENLPLEIQINSIMVFLTFNEICGFCRTSKCLYEKISKIQLFEPFGLLLFEKNYSKLHVQKLKRNKRIKSNRFTILTFPKFWYDKNECEKAVTAVEDEAHSWCLWIRLDFLHFWFYLSSKLVKMLLSDEINETPAFVEKNLKNVLEKCNHACIKIAHLGHDYGIQVWFNLHAFTKRTQIFFLTRKQVNTLIRFLSPLIGFIFTFMTWIRQNKFGLWQEKFVVGKWNLQR